MQKINYKIKGKIAEQGMTLKTLSSKTCIPVSTLSDKLNGRSEFKASEIAAISKALALDNIEAYFF